ncbi:hypothetical protein HEK616_30650 [Streptomyces nigrescens]|uniref:Integral membrane protein n=2 Tax=Streptomyces TaxID=1883 RepID=A0ABM7ZTJ4_STRNI|nr:hypothetical protein [Streptomyces nigrescens]MEE4418080.1 hypothetical protein [Streptomyces sp. DSM 41528]BDM69578.1 hypothetical protein HEK616_30650 [Streptomyces nigrescens]
MNAPDPHVPEAPVAETDPFAPSTSALRGFAALGLVLLVVAYGAFIIIVLHQAYSGDGASGPLLDVAEWAMGLSAIVGLSALCLPGDVVSYAARRGAVRLQYALAFAGPVLAAVDFA